MNRIWKTGEVGARVGHALRFPGTALNRHIRKSGAIARDEGASIVEMAVSCTLLFAMLLGVVQVSLALYTYHFVSDAAREATRFAMVRGANCTANVSATYCSPTSALSDGADNGDIQAFVRNLGYPFAHSLTTSTKWYSLTTSSPAAWTTCGATKCNAAGNQVQVTVTDSFPIMFVFWKNTTISINSQSQMVIAQ